MTCFLLLGKRQLKKPAILFLLLLMPLAACGFSGLLKESGSQAAVCLYAPDADELTRAALAKLTAEDGALFSFYTASSEDELYRQVQTGKAECGYVFAPSLTASLDSGRKNGLIRVVTAPDSLLYPVSNETVYAALFEEYSLHLLQKQLSDGRLLSEEALLSDSGTLPELLQETERLYRLHLADGSVFSFDYNYNPVSGEPRPARFPLQTAARLLFLFVPLLCYTAGFSCLEDQKSGFYGVLNAQNRFLAKLSTLLVPLSAGLGCYLLCLVILFGPQEFPAAFTASLSSAAGIKATCGSLVAVWLYSSLCKSRESYTAALPLLLLSGCVWALL